MTQNLFANSTPKPRAYDVQKVGNLIIQSNKKHLFLNCRNRRVLKYIPPTALVRSRSLLTITILVWIG